MINSCNSLTQTTYQEKIKSIEENYKIAKEYTNIGDRFKDTIIKIIS